MSLSRRGKTPTRGGAAAESACELSCPRSPGGPYPQPICTCSGRATRSDPGHASINPIIAMCPRPTLRAPNSLKSLLRRAFAACDGKPRRCAALCCTTLPPAALCCSLLGFPSRRRNCASRNGFQTVRCSRCASMYSVPGGSCTASLVRRRVRNKTIECSKNRCWFHVCARRTREGADACGGQSFSAPSPRQLASRVSHCA